MTSFQKRDPLKVGATGLLALALAFTLAMNFQSLPFVGGKSYVAYFSEAGGLTEGATVRIAGVHVGTVDSVELAGAKVKVSFEVSDAWVGNKSRARIKVGTLLGTKFLAIDPQGSKELKSSEPIPLKRTMSPYDVIEAFSDLSKTVGDLNTEQLAKSFRTISETFSNTPDEVRGALQGLSQLSQTIAKRDQQLRSLLEQTSQFAGTLAARNAEIEKLIEDGNKLLNVLYERRDAIQALLDGTIALSRELTALVNENAKQIGPALEQLDQVTKLLAKNQQNLSRSIKLMAPFTRYFSNVTGSGRWFDTYICGLLPPSFGKLNQEGCLP